MYVSKNVSNYVAEKGINISAMSRATGIKRTKLHASLSVAVEDSKRRPLRDDELLKISIFLGVDPRIFAEKGEEKVNAHS